VSVPAIMLAQGYHGGGHGRGRGGRGGPGMFAMNGAGHGLLSPRIMERLGLTDEQRASVEAIIAEEQPAVHELRSQLREGQQAFHANNNPATFDETAARAFAEAQAAVQAEILVAGMRTRARIHAVLTPEQASQLSEMHGRLQGRRRGPAGL
jgi:Spy/CpxP family protein refolding chaperone